MSLAFATTRTVSRSSLDAQWFTSRVRLAALLLAFEVKLSWFSSRVTAANRTVEWQALVRYEVPWFHGGFADLSAQERLSW